MTDHLRRALIRGARTFGQAFLGVVTGAPLLDLNVPTLKAAAVAGLGAVLALAQNTLETAADAPVPRG